jgi:hypothetical protein
MTDVFDAVPLPDDLKLGSIDESKGRGLCAMRAFSAGEIVLADRKLVGIQTVDSRPYVCVCQFCFGFLGTVELQLNLLAEQVSPSALATATPKDRMKLPNLEGSPTTLLPIIRCQNGCGELYCSEICRARSWASGHCKLCIGKIDDNEHPLVQFKIHSMENNEVFLQVAAVICHIICEAETGVGLETALLRFPFVRGLWWDIVRQRNTNTKLDDPEDLKADILRMTTESLALLTAALQPTPQFASLFEYDFFSSVIGMFEYNQLGIVMESPAARYYRSLFSFDLDAKVLCRPNTRNTISPNYHNHPNQQTV